MGTLNVTAKGQRYLNALVRRKGRRSVVEVIHIRINSNIMAKETIEIEDVTVEAETDLALLCIIDDKQRWIPKSVLHEDSEISGEGEIGTIVVMRWFAEKEGLI